MVTKWYIYMYQTAKLLWDSQTSSPQTVLLTGLLRKIGVVVLVVLVCVGGGGRHFKVKGCGGNACPPTPILACVLLTIACFQDCTQQYLSDFKCKLSVNSVRNSLEANSKFSCKCISKFIRGHPTGPPPPRVPTAEG